MAASQALTTNLTGQTALVTGASSGLGRRFARVLADAGAKVAIAARRRERLDELAAEIREAGGIVESIVLDVADAKAIPAAVDLAEKKLGPVTILVNNAGIGLLQPAIDQSLEEIDELIAINLRAPFLLAREVARRLIERGLPGRIVNLSSIGAFSLGQGIPAALYCVTKAGMTRMTEVLAIEWAKHNINVNAIAPSFFRSEMSDPNIAIIGEERLVASMPRKRIGEPHQLDSTLLYLVSPASECVTGVCIIVDDGMAAR